MARPAVETWLYLHRCLDPVQRPKQQLETSIWEFILGALRTSGPDTAQRPKQHLETSISEFILGALRTPGSTNEEGRVKGLFACAPSATRVPSHIPNIPECATTYPDEECENGLPLT